MTRASINVAPPNALLLIRDPATTGGIPDDLRDGEIAATPTCVALATRMPIDGATTVTLTDEGGSTVGDLRHDRALETPSRTVQVLTVMEDLIVELAVPSARTRLRIWTNDPDEPDQVVILADAAR